MFDQKALCSASTPRKALSPVFWGAGASNLELNLAVISLNASKVPRNVLGLVLAG